VQVKSAKNETSEIALVAGAGERARAIAQFV